LLGPLIVRRDHARVELGPYRQRAVLAVLAVHAGSVVSVDRLVDLVWSDEPPATAQATLQAYVSNLRRVLEPGVSARASSVLITEGRGYVLRLDACAVDAVQFEQLFTAARSGDDPDDALSLVEQALRLWRGPPLLDFEHENFTVAWRARLDDLRADAVEQRVDLLLRLGRASDAVVELTGAVAEWPLRERLRAQQVTALGRLERQADALRAYEAARRYLAEELGLSPGAELEAARRLVAGHERVETDRGLAPGLYAFLFTDLEESTPQWQMHPVEMAAALALHDDIVQDMIRQNDGRVFATGGDGFAAVFPTPVHVVHAALGIQRRLAEQEWPSGVSVRARMGVHTGTAEQRDSSFFGTDVNRTARLAAAALGGQIVLSQAAAGLVRDRLPPDATLDDLGDYVLKGLRGAERVYQLVAEGLAAPRGGLRANRPSEGNLPSQVTSFIGREREVAALIELLGEQRVVSLVGAGGSGKTRLAIEAARRVAGSFPDGVWLCELAAVSASTDVAYAVASALRARPEQGGSVIDAIVERLRGGRSLVVLDNCEHVLDATVEIVARVAAGCEGVTVLTTSREPLAVQGERLVAVAGLTLASEAPMLFWDRADAVAGNDDAGEGDRVTVREICSHLDGMPLAIELAAARTRTMSIAELSARIDDRFRLLRGPARDRPNRHQTLLAAIDWSYRLLGDEERRLFDQLCVFPASFDAGAVAAVCRTNDRAVVDELLHQLVDKSVVTADRTQPTTRFLLLETLRQYAATHVNDPERARLEQALLSHYLRAGRDARSHLVGSEGAAGRGWFEREWHNVRTAVDLGIRHGDQACVIALLDTVHWYAEASGLVEVGAWAETAIARFGEHPALLGMAAFYATLRGENAMARNLAGRGIALTGDDDPDTRLCWQALQLVHWYGGDAVAANDAQLNVVRLIDPVAEPYAASFAYAVVGGTSALIGRTDGPQMLAESARLAAPLHNATLEMWHTFMSAAHAMAEQRLEDALHGFQRAAAQAADCGAVVWEGRARGVQSGIAVSLGRGDAVRTTTYEMLSHYYATRRWSEIESLLEHVLRLLVADDELADAGLILGFLEANDLHHSLSREHRPETDRRITSDERGRAALGRGREISHEQLIGYLLDRLRPAQPPGEADTPAPPAS
jgi:predicted ATPase/DNA-binding SARP family transcriptional activator